MSTLVLLLWIIAGSAAKDFRNETIACVFQKYDACYNYISTLGASFTHRSDMTVQELAHSCKNEADVQNCIMNVAPICRSNPEFGSTQRITSLVHNICTNKSVDQIMFLNSSSCYNQYYYKRDECVKKYDVGKNTDAKSLCCSNLKTLRCLAEDMQSVCPRNYTQFRTNLTETYRGYHTLNLSE
ncbi:hypothetical protein JTE90_000149 [Oedothorax gibbosus]|uniref:Uncharacterized protein n=1 Tax=Oedothorax gibbosus TaxID=931172 RepID=A0AAV6U4B0_9ARAC|nr:hypothetical protein JTE90_000149 [Oedothorax gibbosus]